MSVFSVDVRRMCSVSAVAATLLVAYLQPGLSADSQTTTIDFSRQIRPLLSDKCFRCHGPDDESREGDLRLDLEEFAHQSAIAAGNVGASQLIKRITSDDPEMRMPPADSNLELSREEVDLLTQWVAQGANYTVHWSYEKPRRPALPETPNDTWTRNEIDSFILARLVAAGLEPSPEADRETLIRRLSLDLTGLPPSVHEVVRFVNDQRPKSWERLVDRLLATQHYGERMAQDWLDLARYGDTNGYENDSDRSMWLYRDWVINAFNTNMPFDRFTIEQIAGDLLPQADASQKIASGFNRNTTYNEEGGSDAEEFMVVYAAERASTTATVFLGLTMGCAQCHEHKYDPISQQEFYQFYAFFNSVDGELGATGHDIPLPPLLSLPTREQAESLQQVSTELTSLEAQIKSQVAKVQLRSGSSRSNSVDSERTPVGDVVEATDSGEIRQAGDTEPAEPTHFTTQHAWEHFERSREKSRLPKKILRLVKILAADRNDEQQTQLRDYFVQHAYLPVKDLFEPLNKRQAELKGQKEKLDAAIPTTMVMAEMKERRPAYVLVRGDFQMKAEEVTPNVPSIFPPLPADKPRTRLGLAWWLVDPDHPLTARVAVNRLWSRLFGAGLVRTMDDFGVRGEFPSHPALLDWLATEFIRTGWNVKAMQKEIVMSAAYRQSSRWRPDVVAVDPYNELLSRQSRFRLSAEGIRDSALSVSGLLNPEIGGPSVFPYQPEGYYSDKGRWKWTASDGKALYRRGLYTFWRRTTTYPTFRIFDAPSREVCSVSRPRTNTPLQALVTLNDPTFVDAARAFAKRIIQDGGPSLEERLNFAFRSTLSRLPDDVELQTLSRIHDEQLARFQTDTTAALELVSQGDEPVAKPVGAVQLATWIAVANVLLNLDETLTRD